MFANTAVNCVLLGFANQNTSYRVIFGGDAVFMAFSSRSTTSIRLKSAAIFPADAVDPPRRLSFLPPWRYKRFASRICVISSRNFPMRSLTDGCMKVG